MVVVPIPAPGCSLGGVKHMSARRTGCVTVDRTPGDYVMHLGAYAMRGMTRSFSVE